MGLHIELKQEVHEGYEYVSFYGSVTHNLKTMAKVVDIYEPVWYPENCELLKSAKDLVEPLRNALRKLARNPEFYKTFNARNGYGTYEQFVEFLQDYLVACLRNPDAQIYVDR